MTTSISEVYSIILTLYGPRHEKTCLPGVENNKGADKLISAFVIRLLESIISGLAMSKILIF